MSRAAELADRYAAALIARENDSSEGANRLIDVCQESLAEAGRAGPKQFQDELIRELTRHLRPEDPPRVFGLVATTAGMIVEWGGDPGIALPAILDRLPGMFGGVPAMVEHLEKHFGTYSLDNTPPEKWRPIAEKSDEARLAARAFFALRFAGCAAMTMLARSPELRIEARKRAELVETADAAKDDNPYAYYISTVLGMTDGEELLVIDVARKLGFRVLLTGVRNNFHLFTLLQGELLSHPSAAEWSGRRPHPLAVALARTDRLADDIPKAEWQAYVGDVGHASDSAIWTFYQWPALQPDGSFQKQSQVPRGQIPWWVWGETTPRDIRAFEGQRVVLLGPLEVSRSWDANFFMPVHGDLKSSAAITATLTSDEVAAWLERIRNAPR